MGISDDSIYLGVDDLLVTKCNFVSLKSVHDANLPALGHSPVPNSGAETPLAQSSKRLKSSSWSPISPVSMSHLLMSTDTPRSVDSQISENTSTPVDAVRSGWDDATSMDCDVTARTASANTSDVSAAEDVCLETWEITWKDTRRKGGVMTSCRFSTTVAGYVALASREMYATSQACIVFRKHEIAYLTHCWGLPACVPPTLAAAASRLALRTLAHLTVVPGNKSGFHMDGMGSSRCMGSAGSLHASVYGS